MYNVYSNPNIKIKKKLKKTVKKTKVSGNGL